MAKRHSRLNRVSNKLLIATFSFILFPINRRSDRFDVPRLMKTSILQGTPPHNSPPRFNRNVDLIAARKPGLSARALVFCSH